jgi:hypothetical protein
MLREGDGLFFIDAGLLGIFRQSGTSPRVRQKHQGRESVNDWLLETTKMSYSPLAGDSNVVRQCVTLIRRAVWNT